jgi:hypothetical protein
MWNSARTKRRGEENKLGDRFTRIVGNKNRARFSRKSKRLVAVETKRETCFSSGMREADGVEGF